MANSAPPHTFKLDSSWPTWDKYRSARLAWYEFAQKKGFVAKHLATQHTISLACAHAGCEAECFIEFRGDVRAEKVTHLVLEHNHRLSKLNGALAQAQAKKITALKDDLYEYGLGELNRINLNGSYEKAVEADRPALQQSTLLDLRRALKSRALTVLEAAARDAGYLIGFESKDKAIIIPTGQALRPRKRIVSSPLSSSPPIVAVTPPVASHTTPLPHQLRTFASMGLYAAALSSWCRSQGFGVQSAGGDGSLRICALRRTAVRCQWFVKVKAVNGRILVVNSCFQHTHALQKPAMGTGDEEAAPSSSQQRRETPRTVSASPEQSERSVRSASPTPGPIVRKRERSATPRFADASDTASVATESGDETTDRKRQRRESSLSEVSTTAEGSDEDPQPSSSSANGASQGDQEDGTPPSRVHVEAAQPAADLTPQAAEAGSAPTPAFTPPCAPSVISTLVATPSNPHATSSAGERLPPTPAPTPSSSSTSAETDLATFLQSLIPPIPDFGLHFAPIFHSLGVDRPEYLVWRAREGRLDEVLDQVGQRRELRVLWREDLRKGLMRGVGKGKGKKVQETGGEA